MIFINRYMILFKINVFPEYITKKFYLNKSVSFGFVDNTFQ